MNYQMVKSSGVTVRFFRDSEGEYELRGRWNFKQPIVHTTLKSMRTSVYGGETVEYFN